MLNDQENQKNLLIAIVLSIAVLLAWQFLFVAPRQKEEQERLARLRQEQQAKAAKEQQPAPSAPVPGQPTQPAQPGAAPAATAPTVFTTREAALDASPRVGIDAPSVKGSISLKGGRIDDVVLRKYREEVSPSSPNVVLFSPSGSPSPFYAQYGWTTDPKSTQPMPTRETVWRVEKDGPLTAQSPVTLAWENGQGLLFRRTISIDDNYLFRVSDEVVNNSGGPVSLYPYALISRHGLPKLEGLWLVLHEGFVGALGESGVQEVGYSDVLKDGGTKTFEQKGGWLGFTDKYWGAALIADKDTKTRARFSGKAKGAEGAKDTFQVDLSAGPLEVAAGDRAAFTTHLFAGAKVAKQIEAYGEQLGARRFDMLIDWGYFWFLTKPLFQLLHWLSGLLGNYGLAILATTVLVKLLFFPLANKSYESMAKMKLLQPEMEKLRERYKDDRAKMQQELMALYREKKINPMAGCLPILLQIPVFFALYKVLYITIDMRQAPFFGWIQDLSARDPTTIFNLFGLLPYGVPDLLHVGVWPIIMGITMWVQMQLNPQQPDPMQQKIFNWMPVLFTFMLANFAVGLVIYWAWNNVLSLLQQYTIMKRNGAEIHLWKNIGLEKALARMRAGEGPTAGELVARGGASVRRGAEKLAEQADALRKTAAAKLQGSKGSSEPYPKGNSESDPKGNSESGDRPRGPSGDGAAAVAKPDMTREQALRTLGLKPGATLTQIEAAYRARARQKGGLNGSEKLSRAREVLRGGDGA
jgi:YidC/Oxa1 family membrane protein insertase